MKKLIPIMFFVFAVCFLGAVLLWDTESSVVPAGNTLDAEKLTALVNDWRVKSGFQPYEKHKALCRIANERTRDPDRYTHNLFLEKYGNYPSVISENKLEGSYTDQHALDSWLSSPPHKKALETPYRYSCIATSGLDAIQIFSNCENSCP